MTILEGLFQSLGGTFPFLVAVLLLLFVYLHSSGISNPEKGQEPPGPKSLPILGNLLLLDLKKPYESLCEVGSLLSLIYDGLLRILYTYGNLLNFANTLVKSFKCSDCQEDIAFV